MISLPELLTSTDLPTIPTIPLKLLEVRSDSKSSLRDFTEVIRNDPAICSRLISLANSSAFATRFDAKTIDRAVQVLGPSLVIGTAFSLTLSETTFNNAEQKRHFDDFWTQSIVQAVAARVIGKQLSEQSAGDHFLNGLLLDLGKLALLNVAASEYIPVLEQFGKTRQPLTHLEQEQLKLDHVEVGVELMKSWNFPEEIISVLQSHHQPIQELQASQAGESVAIGALASLIGDYFCTSRRVDAFLQLKLDSKSLLGFDQQQLEDLLAEISMQIAEVGDIFHLPPGTNISAADILNLVNKELARLVTSEVTARTDLMTQYAEKEEEICSLSEKANLDPLTGLYNRRFLQSHLEQTIHQSTRTGSEVSILFIDVDYFKKINDTYGHSFGDEILRNLAQVLKNSLRDADVLARYGGEEFVIIAHDASEEGLPVLGERLRRAVDEKEFQFHDRKVHITISIGATIAIADRTGSNLAERLLAAADTAMYDAKQSGRNCFRIQSLLDKSEQLIDKGFSKLRFSRWLLQHKVLDPVTLLNFMHNLTPPKIVLGQLAVQQGLLTQEQVQETLVRQKTTNELFGQAAIQLNFITTEQVIELLAIQKENPYEIAAELVRKFIITPQESRKLLEEYQKELQFLKLKEWTKQKNLDSTVK